MTDEEVLEKTIANLHHEAYCLLRDHALDNGEVFLVEAYEWMDENNKWPLWQEGVGWAWWFDVPSKKSYELPDDFYQPRAYGGKASAYQAIKCAGEALAANRLSGAVPLASGPQDAPQVLQEAQEGYTYKDSMPATAPPDYPEPTCGVYDG